MQWYVLVCALRARYCAGVPSSTYSARGECKHVHQCKLVRAPQSPPTAGSPERTTSQEEKKRKEWGMEKGTIKRGPMIPAPLVACQKNNCRGLFGLYKYIKFFSASSGGLGVGSQPAVSLRQPRFSSFSSVVLSEFSPPLPFLSLSHAPIC